MIIRNVIRSDYELVSPRLNEWWGGRQMSDMLPRLFFLDHFNDSSFIAEVEGEVIGFLIGFLSQTHKDEAYIHFVGVNPNHRKRGVAKELYHTFFTYVLKEERSIVRCITSPVNKTSIAYHTTMGFYIEQGDKEIDHVHVKSDYDGPGQDRVMFVKEL
ncbi:LOW QUALITY PROTEIN: acetyltransferase, GNAT family [Geomicrobium sp. JCM 19055]|nr:LOW QUALITY PROTEIN: acetyltransferase, GNAT family [Geomicrobium sp. JCM 19055]